MPHTSNAVIPKILSSILIASIALGSNVVGAAFFTYTDSDAFDTAITGFTRSTEHFDAALPGTTVADGGSVGGITFDYSFSGYELAITDGDEFGGTLPAPTTSPSNFLAATIDDLLVGGDDVSFTFAPANAIGLFVISAEEADTTLFDDDLTLNVAGESALLDVHAPARDLGGGNFAYFLGMINDSATFTSASLTAAAPAVDSITYVVDDITLAIVPTSIPAPASLLLLLTGLIGAHVNRRSTLA